MVELVDHVRLGRPEAAGERDELRGGQRLLARDQDLAAEEGLLELGECGVEQRPRGVGCGGLETEARAERLRFHDPPLISGTPAAPISAGAAEFPAR